MKTSPYPRVRSRDRAVRSARQAALLRCLWWLALSLPLSASAAPTATPAAAIELAVPLTSPAAQGALTAAKAAHKSGLATVAIQELERAYASERSPELLYWIARLGEPAAKDDAARLRILELYRHYLFERGPSVDAVQRAELEKRIAAFGEKAAEVVIQGEPDALLCLDGRVLGSIRPGYTHWLAAGTHKLSLGCSKPPFVVDVEAITELPAVVELYAGREPVVRRTVPVVASFDGAAQPPQQLRGLVDALRGELLRSRHYLLPPERLVRELSTSAADCLGSRSCSLPALQRASVRFWFVFSSSRAADSTAPLWKLKVLHAAAGEVCGKEVELCTGTDCEAQVTPAMTTLLAAAVTDAQDCQVGKLTLRSMPSAAAVFVDEEPTALGETPLSLTLRSGARRVTLRKPGYLPRRELFTLAPEQVVAPEPLVLRVNELFRRSQRLRGAAIAVGVVGAVAAITGAVLLAIDNRYSREFNDAQGMPAGIEDLRTWQGGIPALAGGVVLSVSAAILGVSAKRAARAAQLQEEAALR